MAKTTKKKKAKRPRPQYQDAILIMAPTTRAVGSVWKRTTRAKPVTKLQITSWKRTGPAVAFVGKIK